MMLRKCHASFHTCRVLRDGLISGLNQADPRRTSGSGTIDQDCVTAVATFSGAMRGAETAIVVNVIM